MGNPVGLLGKKTTWNLAVMGCMELCIQRANQLAIDAAIIKATRPPPTITPVEAAEAIAAEVTKLAKQMSQLLQDVRPDVPFTDIASKMEGPPDAAS